MPTTSFRLLRGASASADAGGLPGPHTRPAHRVPGLLKHAVRSTLGAFGLEIRRVTNDGDPFAVQRELIRAPAPTIFDVGAHIGDVAAIYRRLFPRAVIHCFEPFPPSFEELERHTAPDRLLSRHRLALSDEAGELSLNSNTSSSTNSLLSTHHQGPVYWGPGVLETTSQVKVKTTTLDSFCLETGTTQIDILKIDVQGAEYQVLRGAHDLLSRGRISLIFLELIMCPTYQGQHALHEYLSYLEAFNYQLLDFYQPVRHSRQIIQTDAIFVARPLLGAGPTAGA